MNLRKFLPPKYLEAKNNLRTCHILSVEREAQDLLLYRWEEELPWGTEDRQAFQVQRDKIKYEVELWKIQKTIEYARYKAVVSYYEFWWVAGLILVPQLITLIILWGVV